MSNAGKAYKPNLNKLARLDARERRRLLAETAYHAFEEQHSAPDSKDRTAAGRLVMACCSALRDEDKHVGRVPLEEYEAVADRLERTAEEIRGARPTRIQAPAGSGTPH